MRMRTLIEFSLVFCSALEIPALAQENATAAQPSASHSIVLDVVVTDKSGKPVSGLQQEDFSVLDNKTPAKITAFHATGDTTDVADSPRQVIFVVDAVNGSQQGLVLEQQQLRKILQQDRGHLDLPTSLVILTDRSSQIQPQPTLNGNDLANALNASTAPHVTGAPHLLRGTDGHVGADRLQISTHTLQEIIRYAETQSGRKFLIWLGPGWPLLTASGQTPGLAESQKLFHIVVAISQQLREARLTLYAVDPSDVSALTYYYQSFLKGVTEPKKVDYGNVAVQVLAIQSGGLVLHYSNDLQKMIATSLADAKAYYTLSLDAAPADHPDEYHALQVKVDKPGLTARTRTGYYAQPYPAAGH